jgi:hypothetical protein
MNAKTNETVRITLAMAYGGLELLARAAAAPFCPSRSSSVFVARFSQLA